MTTCIKARVQSIGGKHQMISLFCGPDWDHLAFVGALRLEPDEATDILNAIATHGPSHLRIDHQHVVL